jgi:hypothetical protein
VPVPVVIVIKPPVVVPGPPTLVAEATTTVTVAPSSDVGDSVATNGETHHHRNQGDKNRSVPDLTAVPARQEPTPDPRAGEEENDDDSLVSLLFSIFGTEKGN